MALLHLIRHASYEAIGRMLHGRSRGVVLDAAGLRQSDRLAELLGGESIDAVYASDLERAIQTARPLGERLGVPVEIRSDLTDVEYGDWAGREVQSLTADPDWRAYNRRRSISRPPGGEATLAVQQRVVGALLEIADRHPDGQAAVVAHGDPIRYALAFFLGMPLDFALRLEVGPASITRIELTGWDPVLRGLNDLSASRT